MKVLAVFLWGLNLVLMYIRWHERDTILFALVMVGIVIPVLMAVFQVWDNVRKGFPANRN